MKCKKCGKECVHERMPEDHMHYGRYTCPDHGLQAWEPKPKNEGKRRDRNHHHRAVWWDNVGFICGVCGITHEELKEPSQWDVDHIIPLSKGGKDKIANTMMLCKSCHTIKNSLQEKTDKFRKQCLHEQS